MRTVLRGRAGGRVAFWGVLCARNAVCGSGLRPDLLDSKRRDDCWPDVSDPVGHGVLEQAASRELDVSLEEALAILAALVLMAGERKGNAAFALADLLQPTWARAAVRGTCRLGSTAVMSAAIAALRTWRWSSGKGGTVFKQSAAIASSHAGFQSLSRHSGRARAKAAFGSFRPGIGPGLVPLSVVSRTLVGFLSRLRGAH
jgi:hypothetical protein